MVLAGTEPVSIPCRRCLEGLRASGEIILGGRKERVLHDSQRGIRGAACAAGGNPCGRRRRGGSNREESSCKQHQSFESGMGVCIAVTLAVKSPAGLVSASAAKISLAGPLFLGRFGLVWFWFEW